MMINRQIWRIWLMRNFLVAGLFTLRVFARNVLRGNSWRNTYFFTFRDLTWPAIRPRPLGLISHQTNDYFTFLRYLRIYMVINNPSIKFQPALMKHSNRLRFLFNFFNRWQDILNIVLQTHTISSLSPTSANHRINQNIGFHSKPRQPLDVNVLHNGYAVTIWNIFVNDASQIYN